MSFQKYKDRTVDLSAVNTIEGSPVLGYPATTGSYGESLALSLLQAYSTSSDEVMSSRLLYWILIRINNPLYCLIIRIIDIFFNVQKCIIDMYYWHLFRSFRSGFIAATFAMPRCRALWSTASRWLVCLGRRKQPTRRSIFNSICWFFFIKEIYLK